MYWVSQKTETCFTDHNSALSAPKLLNGSSVTFEIFLSNLPATHTEEEVRINDDLHDGL